MTARPGAAQTAGPVAVTDDEVEIVRDCITRIRAEAVTLPIQASLVALALSAVGHRDRIKLVLSEMEARGLLERVDQRLDHIVGEPRYRELSEHPGLSRSSGRPRLVQTQRRLFTRPRGGTMMAISEIHSKDGFFFARLEGNVRVRVTDGGLEPTRLEIELEPSGWPSVVAAVSARGEDGATWREALDFHERASSPEGGE